jgi:uncharacterized protein with GYD domain
MFAAARWVREGKPMPKYLWKVSYTAEGVRGVVKEGGTSRRDTIAAIVSGLGGTIEGFFFAFGEHDVFVIAELPDDTTAAAFSLTVGASGAASVDTVKLLTPEEVDKATKVSVPYRPPGA